MTGQISANHRPSPELKPLGDSGLLIRFSNNLDDASNAAAIAFAARLERAPLAGVVEVAPSLVSVFLRYDPTLAKFSELAGAVRLMLSERDYSEARAGRSIAIEVTFGGSAGPDLGHVAKLCGMGEADFVAAHNRTTLRVLAAGFAPGFVYCGLHPPELHVPRLDILHPKVRAGSILFAAGQTSITATDGPTGWNVIGRTEFRNFDATLDPPTTLRAGDHITFVSVP